MSQSILHVWAIVIRAVQTHGSTREIGDPFNRTRPRPGVTWATAVAVCNTSACNSYHRETSLTFFLPKHWTADIIYLRFPHDEFVID
jgi:hypothetical protein